MREWNQKICDRLKNIELHLPQKKKEVGKALIVTSNGFFKSLRNSAILLYSRKNIALSRAKNWNQLRLILKDNTIFILRNKKQCYLSEQN